MTITGSGKFVAIAASNTQIDALFPTPMTGITFGVGSTKYCQISSKYEVNLLTVTGTALCFEPGVTNANLYIGFQNRPNVRVNGYTGYTGNIWVLDDCDVDSVTGTASRGWRSYSFKSGLLVQ